MYAIYIIYVLRSRKLVDVGGNTWGNSNSGVKGEKKNKPADFSLRIGHDARDLPRGEAGESRRVRDRGKVGTDLNILSPRICMKSRR